MSSQKETVRAIVDELLALPATDREARLWEACGDDETLRAEVTSELTVSIKGNAARIDLSEGDQVGSYRILDVLGEGGMGTVFLAEQRKPVLRRVALKVVKLGMDTQEVLSRFEAERQALAMMSHPNVAAVLDAGATELGRPYFAMEYVAGLPITEYCDRNRLSISERVDLFRQACRGVEHAHQKGLIHRDLKPSNILVTNKDGSPLVKIIDFGIAKSTQQRLTANTLYTQLGVFIGTPDYTSPEQASRDAEDVDTRTDVYSLGVVLYELVVGVPPYGRAMFTGKDLPEIVRIIRNSEPPTPSDRFARLSGMNEALARNRSAAIDHVLKRLKSDLAAILHKSMEKDRNHRYDSVSAFRRDLQQFLAGAPVEARPLTSFYRLSRFVMRNRAAVGTGLLIFSLLAGATIVSTIQFFRARSAAERANEAALVALKGQSKYLALLADDAIENWQHDKALLLALNAMPGAYGGERPAVPEAQIALNRAAYHISAWTTATLDYEVASAVLSPDATLVAPLPRDGSRVQVFDLKAGKPLFSVDHGEQVIQAAFSADDAHFATLARDGLRVWRVATGELAWHAGDTVEVELEAPATDSPVSDIFATISNTALTLPQPKFSTFDDPNSRPAVEFNPAGDRVMYRTDAGHVTTHDVTAGRRIHEIPVEATLAFYTADGSTILALDQETDRLFAIDASSGEWGVLADDLEVILAPSGPNGRLLVNKVDDGLQIYDTNGRFLAELMGTLARKQFNEPSLFRLQLPSPVTAVAIGNDLIARGAADDVLVWGGETWTLLERLRAAKIQTVAISPGDDHIAAGSGLGEVWLWDTESFGNTGQRMETTELPLLPDSVIFVGFARGGRDVVAVSKDGTLSLWRSRSTKRVLDGWSRDTDIAAVFSSDGRFVARYDETVSELRIWSTETGAQVGLMDAAINRPRSNSFRPESNQVVVSNRFTSRLGTVQPGAEVWSIGASRPTERTGPRQTRVDVSEFIMKGDRIVTAALGDTPSVTIWDSGRGMILKLLDGERFLAGAAEASRVLTLIDGRLRIHDIDGDRHRDVTPGRSLDGLETLPAAFSHDGRRFVVDVNGMVELRDADTGELIDSVIPSAPPTHLGIGQDGGRWYVAVDGMLTIRESGVVVDQVPVGAEVQSVVLTDGGLVTLSARGSVTTLDIPDNIEVATAITLLPPDRTCLTTRERAEYDLESLSEAQRLARGCPSTAK